MTKGTRQGGSTITQQYAERYYMGETTSYVGKAREAIMAIKIAQTESKDEVLCNYMNTIYLGRNSYGIQAAAKAYFNKDAKDLTLSEAAMIASIIPSPSTWDPADNADMAKSRFKRVLNIMQEDGYITAKQHTDAKFPQTAAVAQQNRIRGAERLSAGYGAPRAGAVQGLYQRGFGYWRIQDHHHHRQKSKQGSYAVHRRHPSGRHA